jgi:hypothetical protein
LLERLRTLDVVLAAEGRLAGLVQRLEADLADFPPSDLERAAQRLGGVARSLAEWEERTTGGQSAVVWIVLAVDDPLRGGTE